MSQLQLDHLEDYKNKEWKMANAWDELYQCWFYDPVKELKT